MVSIAGIVPPPRMPIPMRRGISSRTTRCSRRCCGRSSTHIPALEQLRVERAWAGHYEVNTLDHNGVLGPHDEVANLILATGFSGHGLQHAPATGRGVAEWILHGGYRSLDLSPLGYAHIRAGEPLHETVVY